MIRKVPKIKTIRGRINFYAHKCGFLLVKQHNGLYNIFDIHMNYNVYKNVDMDTVVRVVSDEMYAIMYRNSPSIVGA